MSFIEKYGEPLARTMKIAPDTECNGNPFLEELEELNNRFKTAIEFRERCKDMKLRPASKVPLKRQTKKEKAMEEAGVVELTLF